MESILTSIKKLLGISEEDTSFDTDVIMHINTVFMTLNQLGVGPSDGFTISDKSAVWTDFVPNIKRIEAIKTFVHLKVKLVFDPPLGSAVIACLEKAVSELEWRINVEAENMEREAKIQNESE